MPIYEFICKSCDNKFTKRTKMAEKDRITCPECSSDQLKENFATEFKTSAQEKAKNACNLLFRGGLSGG